jgi:hypothetical protein
MEQRLPLRPREAGECLQAEVAVFAIIIAAKIELIGGAAVPVRRLRSDDDRIIDWSPGDLEIPGTADGVYQPCRAAVTSVDLPKLKIFSVRDLQSIGAPGRSTRYSSMNGLAMSSCTVTSHISSIIQEFSGLFQVQAHER